MNIKVYQIKKDKADEALAVFATHATTIDKSIYEKTYEEDTVFTHSEFDVFVDWYNKSHERQICAGDIIEADGDLHYCMVSGWREIKWKVTLHGVLVDVEKGTIAKVDITDSLEEFYRVLNCRCIDAPDRQIGKLRCTIICDDEGLLKDSPRVAAVDSAIHPMLVGNLFVCSAKGENFASLSDEDCDYILNNCVQAVGDGKGNMWKALSDVEY